MKASGHSGFLNCVAFRVDGARDIGAGHIMRCLTLANSLKSRGITCHFLTMPNMGPLEDAIRFAGHSAHSLVVECDDQIDDGTPLFHSHWLRHSQNADSSACAQILAELKPIWLILDHYALDWRWQRNLTSFVHRQLSIDDLADRSFISDIHVDPNPLNREKIEEGGLLPNPCLKLIGCDYAVLRSEFLEVQRRVELRRTNLELLIMMGGVDHSNATSDILRLLLSNAHTLSWISEVTVVLGATALNRCEVQSLGSSLPCRFEVLQNPPNMAEVMANADLCIGAAGGSAWERCAVGLPSLLVILAENQKPIAHFLEEEGAALVVEHLDTKSLLETLTVLYQPENRHSMRQRATALVDGRGTERVISTMDSLQ